MIVDGFWMDFGWALVVCCVWRGECLYMKTPKVPFQCDRPRCTISALGEGWNGFWEWRKGEVREGTEWGRRWEGEKKDMRFETPIVFGINKRKSNDVV
jgi:hypothetical protein